VKEVRVQSKATAEVWYAFPRPQVAKGAFVDSQIWLRGLVSVRTARAWTWRPPPPGAEEGRNSDIATRRAIPSYCTTAIFRSSARAP
jgi:hypothetical protein